MPEGWPLEKFLDALARWPGGFYRLCLPGTSDLERMQFFDERKIVMFDRILESCDATG